MPAEGKNTSEFKLTGISQYVGAAIVVLGVVALLFLDDKGTEAMTAIGIGATMLGITTGAYAISRGNAKKAAVLLMALSLMLIGCGSPASTLTINADGNTEAKGAPISEVRLPVSVDENGKTVYVQGTFTGASPTGALIDTEGIHMLGGGPNGLMAFNPLNGMFFLASPRDVTMRDVEFTPNPAPGKPSFKASEITANASPVILALNEQYASAMKAMEGMTQEEAKVYIQRAITAGEMLPVVAEMLLKSFVPTLPAVP